MTQDPFNIIISPIPMSSQTGTMIGPQDEKIQPAERTARERRPPLNDSKCSRSRFRVSTKPNNCQFYQVRFSIT